MFIIGLILFKPTKQIPYFQNKIRLLISAEFGLIPAVI